MKDNWKDYLDKDFGQVEKDGFHVDGYVYYAEEPADKPYRLLQFCWCYIPLDKRNDEDYVNIKESECKQYIEDCTEEEARKAIEWYLANAELL